MIDLYALLRSWRTNRFSPWHYRFCFALEEVCRRDWLLRWNGLYSLQRARSPLHWKVGRFHLRLVLDRSIHVEASALERLSSTFFRHMAYSLLWLALRASRQARNFNLHVWILQTAWLHLKCCVGQCLELCIAVSRRHALIIDARSVLGDRVRFFLQLLLGRIGARRLFWILDYNVACCMPLHFTMFIIIES